MPALLTRPCRPPNFSAASTAVCQSASCVTSAARKLQHCRVQMQVDDLRNSSTSPITTRAPSAENKRASAAPCPRAPPLINMTFPFRRSMRFLLIEWPRGRIENRRPGFRCLAADISSTRRRQSENHPGSRSDLLRNEKAGRKRGGTTPPAGWNRPRRQSFDLDTLNRAGDWRCRNAGNSKKPVNDEEVGRPLAPGGSTGDRRVRGEGPMRPRQRPGSAGRGDRTTREVSRQVASDEGWMSSERRNPPLSHHCARTRRGRASPKQEFGESRRLWPQLDIHWQNESRAALVAMSSQPG